MAALSSLLLILTTVGPYAEPPGTTPTPAFNDTRPLNRDVDPCLPSLSPEGERGCPANEHYERCGDVCVRSCIRYDCPLRCCAEGCFCDDGHVRGPDGTCIPEEECPRPFHQTNRIDADFRECGPDEYISCDSHCQRNCSNHQEAILCDKTCVLDCVCVPPKIRGPLGNCILPHQCLQREEGTNRDDWLICNYIRMMKPEDERCSKTVTCDDPSGCPGFVRDDPEDEILEGINLRNAEDMKRAAMTCNFVRILGNPPAWSESCTLGLFRRKCFEDLGCFDTGPPFFHPKYRPISVEPASHLRPKFLLYTPTSPQVPQVLVPTKESLGTSTLDPNLETKILIHGYRVKLWKKDVNFKIKNVLLQKSPMNVIIVDWTANNHFPYYQAVANARVVGAQVAMLINYHVETMQLDPGSFHVIGHSLGGQMTGWVGEKVPGLDRITGLDPAGPWFQCAPPEVRLDPTDAELVDVIHTNGGKHSTSGYGLYDPMGHLDFYPNGGSRQPGCVFQALRQTDGVRNRSSDDKMNYCSHMWANNLFLDSIDRCRFAGVECATYDEFREGKCTPGNSAVSLMGYHATKLPTHPNSTIFYLVTSDEFCGETNEMA